MNDEIYTLFTFIFFLNLFSRKHFTIRDSKCICDSCKKQLNLIFISVYLPAYNGQYWKEVVIEKRFHQKSQSIQHTKFFNFLRIVVTILESWSDSGTYYNVYKKNQHTQVEILLKIENDTP